MITIATATARPSSKYLIARVTSSVIEKPSILSLYSGWTNYLCGKRGLKRSRGSSDNGICRRAKRSVS
jgi:hypothetical protein